MCHCISETLRELNYIFVGYIKSCPALFRKKAFVVNYSKTFTWLAYRKKCKVCFILRTNIILYLYRYFKERIIYQFKFTTNITIKNFQIFQ